MAAQMALQLAEQMVKEDRVDAAKANLQQAKNQFVLYRDLIGEDERDDVKNGSGHYKASSKHRE